MTLLKCTVVPWYKYLVPGTTFAGTLFVPKPIFFLIIFKSTRFEYPKRRDSRTKQGQHTTIHFLCPVWLFTTQLLPHLPSVEHLPLSNDGVVVGCECQRITGRIHFSKMSRGG